MGTREYRLRRGLIDVPTLTLTRPRFGVAAFPPLLFDARPSSPQWRIALYGPLSLALRFPSLSALSATPGFRRR